MQKLVSALLKYDYVNTYQLKVVETLVKEQYKVSSVHSGQEIIFQY